MLRCVLISRRNLDIEHQAQPGHRVSVVTWLGRPGFWVVAKHGPFLMAVEQLDSRIRVRIHGSDNNGAVPSSRWCCSHSLPSISPMALKPAHRVLADDLLHAQQLGEHAIAAKRRDVGIAFMPHQNRKHRCAKHVALLGALGLVERAIGHERVEQFSTLRYSMKNGSCP